MRFQRVYQSSACSLDVVFLCKNGEYYSVGSIETNADFSENWVLMWTDLNEEKISDLKYMYVYLFEICLEWDGKFQDLSINILNLVPLLRYTCLSMKSCKMVINSLLHSHLNNKKYNSGRFSKAWPLAILSPVTNAQTRPVISTGLSQDNTCSYPWQAWLIKGIRFWHVFICILEQFS